MIFVLKVNILLAGVGCRQDTWSLSALKKNIVKQEACIMIKLSTLFQPINNKRRNAMSSVQSTKSQQCGDSYDKPRSWLLPLVTNG